MDDYEITVKVTFIIQADSADDAASQIEATLEEIAYCWDPFSVEERP